jgi:integration host factor subunit alpha
MNNKTIDRRKLSRRMADNPSLNISVLQATHFIEMALTEITDILQSEQTLKLPMFGVFAVSEKKERMGRNPMTMEKAIISARRVARFNYSRPMRDRINNAIKAKKEA